MKYKAFISYKHSIYSRSQAITLERALKQYAKPLLQRPERIFRDEKQMVPNPDLSNVIKKGLEESEYLIFLAEKEAAVSPWCRKEINYWCGELKRAEKLIIVHIEDRIVTDVEKNKIDWESSDALPRDLEFYLDGIPLYIDLSWAKENTCRNIENEKYRETIIPLCAKLRGITPEELNDEEIQVFRRNRNIKNWAVLVLTFLLFISTGMMIFARGETQKAKRRKATALSALAIQELNNFDPWVSYRLAEEAFFLNPDDFQIRGTFMEVLSQFHPHLVLKGHSSIIQGAAFSADNTKLLTYCFDGSIRIWFLSNPDSPIVFYVKKGKILNARFNRAGDSIIILSEDSTATIRRFPNTDSTIVLERGAKLLEADFWTRGDDPVWSTDDRGYHLNSPDDSLELYYNYNGQAKLFCKYDVQYPVVLKDSYEAYFEQYEDRVLIKSSDGPVKIWLLGDLSNPIVLNEKKEYYGDFFFQNGGSIISSNQNGILRIWSIAEPNNPRSFNGQFQTWEISAENEQLYTYGNDGRNLIWSLSNAEIPSVILNGFDGAIKGAQFSKDGLKLLLYGDHELCSWILAKPENPIVFKNFEGDFIDGAAFSQNGSRVLAYGGGKVSVWALSNPETPKTLQGNVGRISQGIFVENDTKVLIYGDGITMQLWSIDEPTQPISLPGHFDAISGVTLTRDRKRMLSYSQEGKAMLWSLEDLENPIELKGHTNTILGAVFNRNEDLVTTFGYDNTARIWSLSDPENPLVFSGHDGTVFDAAFSNDESRFLTIEDGTVRIWDLNLERVIKNLYKKYPVLMRIKLDEEMKNKYGLEGLFIDRFGTINGPKKRMNE